MEKEIPCDFEIVYHKPSTLTDTPTALLSGLRTRNNSQSANGSC